MTDKLLIQLNIAKEEIEDILDEYGFDYKISYDDDLGDEALMDIIVRVDRKDQKPAQVTFRISEESMKIHGYEDVYYAFTKEGVWSALFFSIL